MFQEVVARVLARISRVFWRICTATVASVTMTAMPQTKSPRFPSASSVMGDAPPRS